MKDKRKYTGEGKLYILRNCLSLVEKKANLGPSGDWTSKDYENLSLLIERDTGVLISVSTLRRLWSKKYKGSPQKATMDALAKFAGSPDWLNFLQESQNRGEKPRGSKQHISTFLIILAAMAVLSITALFVSKNMAAEGERKGEIHVIKNHNTGPETGVISTAGNALVLGKPKEEGDILSGDLGWNIVVHTEKGPVARESYKKALELNPGRERTLSKLNKLEGPAF